MPKLLSGAEIVFKSAGKEIPYNLKIRNSMRLNNEISPIQNLENVLDLGLIIETSN